MASKYGDDTTLTRPEIHAIAAALRALAARAEADCREDSDGALPEAVASRTAWLRAMAAKLRRVRADLKYYYEPILTGLEVAAAAAARKRAMEAAGETELSPASRGCAMFDFSWRDWQKVAAMLRLLEGRLRASGNSPRVDQARRRIRGLAQKAGAIAEWWRSWHEWLADLRRRHTENQEALRAAEEERAERAASNTKTWAPG